MTCLGFYWMFLSVFGSDRHHIGCIWFLEGIWHVWRLGMRELTSMDKKETLAHV